VLVGHGKRINIYLCEDFTLKNHLGRGFANISKLDWMVESKIKEFGFYEYKVLK